MSQKEDALFVLTHEDAQLIAMQTLGRELSSEELCCVRKGLEYRLLDWPNQMERAIKNAAEAVRT
ncbi:MAG: hypothetical protein HZA48_03400 [Planctomycetes bacterium]|nr:hypothetical protein [Planctomycetota bacterium]